MDYACTFSPLWQLAAYVGIALLAGGCAWVLAFAHGKDRGRAEERADAADWEARKSLRLTRADLGYLRPAPPPNTTSTKGGT